MPIIYSVGVFVFLLANFVLILKWEKNFVELKKVVYLHSEKVQDMKDFLRAFLTVFGSILGFIAAVALFAIVVYYLTRN